jgi:hypothetical protein
MTKKLVIILALVALSSCTGIRRSGEQFTAHAEAFNILGLQIPEDDYKSAMKQVPAGAEIHTVNATANDWTSVLGGLNKILGFSFTQISGKVSK